MEKRPINLEGQVKDQDFITWKKKVDTACNGAAIGLGILLSLPFIADRIDCDSWKEVYRHFINAQYAGAAGPYSTLNFPYPNAKISIQDY